MTKLTVDEELRQRLPSLDRQTYTMLEENVMNNSTYMNNVISAPVSWTATADNEHTVINSADKLPFEMAFYSLTNVFSDELHKNLISNNPIALKAALMFYITELGDLYSNIA